MPFQGLGNRLSIEVNGKGYLDVPLWWEAKLF